jgi:DNA-binding MarR family transcriptional regulator
MKVNTESAEWDPGASVGFWLNNTSRALLRLHDARLREFGFAMAQLPVLVALEDGDALPQKELARRAGIEQPSMVELIARMEKAGLVKRAPHPEDGRVSLISLTPRARKQVPKAKEALMHGEAEATHGLSTQERAQLRELLKRVAHNLGVGD